MHSTLYNIPVSPLPCFSDNLQVQTACITQLVRAAPNAMRWQQLPEGSLQGFGYGRNIWC